jgi:predicted amidohydrolase
MNGFLGEPERVLKAIDGWCERAVAEKAELVLFPELVMHGHCTPNTWALAEPVPDGPSVSALVSIAKRHRLVLCAGMSEKERDIVYKHRFWWVPTAILASSESCTCLVMRGSTTRVAVT